jgi:hypothetical protein
MNKIQWKSGVQSDEQPRFILVDKVDKGGIWGWFEGFKGKIEFLFIIKYMFFDNIYMDFVEFS